MKITTVIPMYKNTKLNIAIFKHNFHYLRGTRIIVADDASGEDIAKKISILFPSVDVYENKENLGFAQNVNRAIMRTKDEYILLLNSDVMLHDTSYERGKKFLSKNSEFFAVSFRLKEKNDEFVGKNSFCKHRGLILHRGVDSNKQGLNAWAEGGAMIMRREMYNKLGGFDPLYSPFYWEDVDLSYRAYKRGWKVYFDPKINVTHHHESTIGRYFTKENVAHIAYRNQFIFFWKNVSDMSLWVKHIVYFPMYIFGARCKYIRSLFEALICVPKILKARNAQGESQTKSDREVLLLFLHGEDDI